MTTKMAAAVVECGEDAFRKLFKYYKRRNPPPDLSGVIDFSKRIGNDLVFATELHYDSFNEETACKSGLRPIKDWRAFGLHGYPGFMFISNPFLPGSQRYWVKQCLKNYPQKPNVCNLDMHMPADETENIWEKSIESIRKKGKQDPRTLLEKLRWVTLGYHYNWDTKTYSADHYTPFPPDLHGLSHNIAAACGFPGFKAEAGILNYYRSDSSLGIHVDESELDHTQPLLSFSFGQTAIFLLGGTKRQDRPTAMLMRSGDVMVMSGSSRLLYHAVPCILLPSTAQPLPHCLIQQPEQQQQEEEEEEERLSDSIVQDVSLEEWEVCSKYLLTSRVNMTVRQVLGSGQVLPNAHPKQSGYDEEETHAKKRKNDSGYEAT